MAAICWASRSASVPNCFGEIAELVDAMFGFWRFTERFAQALGLGVEAAGDPARVGGRGVEGAEQGFVALGERPGGAETGPAAPRPAP